MIAALVIIAGLLFALRERTGRSAPPASPVPPTASMSDSVLNPEVEDSAIERALRLANIDSTSKSRWVDELPGVDLAMLSPAKHELFLRFANAERCTCGCGFTLAGCRQYDSTCEISPPLVARLRDSILAGQIRSADGLRERPLATAR